MTTDNFQSKNSKSVPHKERGAEKLYYFSHYLVNKKRRKLAYLVKRINTLLFKNFIPPEVTIGERLDLPHGGFGVVMHKTTRIGDDAIILHNVTIADGGAQIGDRVYIGTGVVIVGEVKIGDDVKIGANALINFDVPSNAVVVSPLGRILDKKNN
jgi:serine O-acetyltransferase